MILNSETMISNDNLKVILFSIALIFILFDSFLRSTILPQGFSMIDEIIIIGFVFFVLISNRYTNKVFIIWIALIFYLTFSSLLSPYSKGPIVSFIAAFFFTKIFAIFFLGKKIKIQIIYKLLYIITFIHILGFLLNILSPLTFTDLLRETSHELKLHRMVGFELNPNRFGILSASLALFFYFIEKKYIYVSILLVALFLSESRTAIIFLLVCGYYFYTIQKNKKIFGGHTLSILLILPLLTMTFSQGIQENIDNVINTHEGEQKYIRSALLVIGADLAVKNFPLGTGGGTYGSPLSKDSKVYVDAGISDWPSVDEGTGIHDSAIGSILGEYGILGFGVVFFLFYLMFSSTSQITLTKSDIFFLLFIILFLSFFRAIATSYFYSIMIFLVYSMLLDIRSNKVIKKVSN